MRDPLPPLTKIEMEALNKHHTRHAIIVVPLSDGTFAVWSHQHPGLVQIGPLYTNAEGLPALVREVSHNFATQQAVFSAARPSDPIKAPHSGPSKSNKRELSIDDLL